MALTELKGRQLGTQRVVIERGTGARVRAGADGRRPGVHRRRRARAADLPVRDALLGLTRRGGAAGLPIENLRGKGRAILHGEQEFIYHGGDWPHVGDTLVGDGSDLRRVREGEVGRRQARVLRDRDDVEERAHRRAGRHHEVHARDQLQGRRRRAKPLS